MESLIVSARSPDRAPADQPETASAVPDRNAGRPGDPFALGTAVLAVLLTILASVGGIDSARAQPLTATVGGIGIGIGDVPRLRGLRINTRDEHLERVDGVNLTFWWPATNPGSRVHGAAVGLLVPASDVLYGIGVGAIGVHTGRRMAGLAAGGLAVRTTGTGYGLFTAGGLLTGSGTLTGLGAALGAITSGSDLRGAYGAALGVSAQSRIDGLAFTGGLLHAGAGLRGVHLAGLGLLTDGGIVGLSGATLGSIIEGPARGLHAAGLALVMQHNLTGIAASGLALHVDQNLRGVAVAPVATAGRVHGVIAGGFTRASDRLNGLAVGLINLTPNLHGVQIGLLNWAGNNPIPFKLLPLLNVHLD